MTSIASQSPPGAGQASQPDVAWAGFTRSLWSQTAPPPEFYPPVAGTLNVEVAIVGAGFTGLSAALSLLERGVGVAVLEARQPGFGASGRNGGQVNPFTKHEPDALRAMYGEQVGQGIIDLTISSGDCVFELRRRHAIDCDPVQTGFLQGTDRPAGAATLKQRCEAWARAGAQATWLDADAIRQ